MAFAPNLVNRRVISRKFRKERRLAPLILVPLLILIIAMHLDIIENLIRGTQQTTHPSFGVFTVLGVE
jgi:hypothetical protein